MNGEQKNTDIQAKDQLLQRKLGGESVASIAADTGIPRSTIYSWIAAAREAREEDARKKGEIIASDPRTYFKQKEHIDKLEGMVLPVEGTNEAPLYAAISFYDDHKINGSFSKKPHLVLTVAERGILPEDGHEGYVDVVNKALKNGSVLSLDKEKMRVHMPVIADLTRAGNIADRTLTDNVAQFRKEIKSFREKNNINYKTPNARGASSRQLLADAFDELVPSRP